jgi:hypothetical protein
MRAPTMGLVEYQFADLKRLSNIIVFLASQPAAIFAAVVHAGPVRN